MRRSHRLALSALVALAGLVAAGRLATSAVAREASARGAAAARHASDAAGVAPVHGEARAATAPSGDGVDAAEATRPARAAARDAAIDRTRAGRHTAGGAAIALDDPQVALGAALSVSGRDAGAPRAIELWRLAGTRAARVATGTSRPDGSIELPAFVMPAGDVTLVASPRGEGVHSPNASSPVVVSRDPSAPRIVAVEGVAETSALVTVEAGEPGGSIVFARASEQEIGRTPVVAGRDASRAPLAIAVAVAPDDTEILVAQEVPDGRRSPWRHVALDRRFEGE